MVIKMRKTAPNFEQLPYEYMLIISIKKKLIPLIGKPLKIEIFIKNVSEKVFPGGIIDYVFVQPSPFSFSYQWNKLTIPQLNDKEEIKIDEFYYPTSGGEREIKFRMTNKDIGLCMQLRGQMPMLVGNELKIPFRVYSKSDILTLIGAISAIIAAILSGIKLLI